MTPLQIRPAAADDTGYILSTWLNYFKDHGAFARRIRHRIYFEKQHALIRGILDCPETHVLVAHPPEESEVIFGYLVYQGAQAPVVHFAFVKQELRRRGVGRQLFQAAELGAPDWKFTHWTDDVDRLIKKYPEIVYDPYLV